MNEPDGATLAERLSAARRRLNFTQSYVATACGMSQAMYSDLEIGRAKGSTRIATLARLLKVSAYWLETGEGEQDADSGSRVRDSGSEYSPMNDEKAALLAAFDALSPAKRRALLELIRPEANKHE